MCGLDPYLRAANQTKAQSSYCLSSKAWEASYSQEIKMEITVKKTYYGTVRGQAVRWATDDDHRAGRTREPEVQRDVQRADIDAELQCVGGRHAHKGAPKQRRLHLPPLLRPSKPHMV